MALFSAGVNVRLSAVLKEMGGWSAINRNDNYRELVERLNHTDRCENDARMLFKVTESGWDKAA